MNAGQWPCEHALRRQRAEIQRRVREEQDMPASPVAEAVILAHDVHGKDKKTLDVIAFEVGVGQLHGADELEVARIWLRRLARDPANHDVLCERFPAGFVSDLLAERSCSACDGTGVADNVEGLYEDDEDCAKCNGTGRQPDLDG